MLDTHGPEMARSEAAGENQDGSAIGARYRHLTPQVQARVLAVVDRCLATALGSMPQTCPKAGGTGPGSERPDR